MITCLPIQFEDANTTLDGCQSDSTILKLLISAFHFDDALIWQRISYSCTRIHSARNEEYIIISMIRSFDLCSHTKKNINNN